jgi:hypothetical protein
MFWAIATIACLTFLWPRAADAAMLFISPGTGSFKPDQTLTVTVRVDTQGESVNAAEGTIKFDPNRLRVESVSGDDAIFSLNVQQPDFSNSVGTVTFAGVILNPGYTGASGNLLTIRFRARAAGSTAVSFASGAVLANDGKGTDITSGMNGATYTIIGGPTPVPTPADVLTETPRPTVGPMTPDIISPTHPDPNRWYSNNDPIFIWLLPDNIDGVSWLIDPKPDGNPGNILDGLVDEVSFEDVPDGENYFHVKFRRNGGFGPIAHFPFRVDTRPPEPFELNRVLDGDDSDPQPLLTYVTSDSSSDIQQYHMRIGDGEWFDVPEAPKEQPFRMPLQMPGTYEVTVEAIDAAGQATRAQRIITVASIEVPVITRSPDEVGSGKVFRAVGTAAPDSSVQIRAYPAGFLPGSSKPRRPIVLETVLADGSGYWRATLPGLKSGNYELDAIATDARGAVSHPSDKVFLRVGPWLIRQVNALPLWFLSLVLWLRLLLILGLLLLALLLAGFFRRRKHRVVNAARDKKSGSKLKLLIADIENELEMIQRLGKSRPLYPEEKHLARKLGVYRKTLRRIVDKSSPKSSSAKTRRPSSKKV